MAFTLDSFARTAFKLLRGKAHTNTNRDPANEPIASTLQVMASNVWGQKIHPTPADASNTGIISALLTLNLEPVSGTNGTGIYSAYRCKLGGTVPASLTGKTNPLTNAVYAANDYVGNLVPESVGLDFRPKLFTGAAVETPPMDASDWFIDGFSGVVTQEIDVPGNMIDYTTGGGGTVQAYVYIGKTSAEVVQGVADSVIWWENQTIGAGITGVVDDLNDTFTLAHPPVVSSVRVYLNGLETEDFTVTGSDVVFNATSIPSAISMEDVLTVHYRELT